MGNTKLIRGSTASKAYKYIAANRDLIQHLLQKFPDGHDVGTHSYWTRVCFPLFNDKDVKEFAKHVKEVCKYSEQTNVHFQVIKTIYRLRFNNE